MRNVVNTLIKFFLVVFSTHLIQICNKVYFSSVPYIKFAHFTQFHQSIACKLISTQKSAVITEIDAGKKQIKVTEMWIH